MSEQNRGELQVIKLLNSLSDEYIVLNDLLLRNGNGVTQIDHVVVSKYGVFIIETKDYQGLITGSESSEKWCEHFNKKQFYFYNPLRQNYAHIRAVAAVAGISDGVAAVAGISDGVVIPLIAFSDSAKIKVESTKPVVQFRQLIFAIEFFKKERIKDENVVKIAERLKRANIKSEKIMQLHNNVIKAREREQQAKANALICPKCGGKLILRNGKYGQFYGCSSYPKCRFVKKKQ